MLCNCGLDATETRHSGCDWPSIHGIPRWLPAYNDIPAVAKALLHEGALALVRCSVIAGGSVLQHMDCNVHVLARL